MSISPLLLYIEDGSALRRDPGESQVRAAVAELAQLVSAGQPRVRALDERIDPVAALAMELVVWFIPAPTLSGPSLPVPRPHLPLSHRYGAQSLFAAHAPPRPHGEQLPPQSPSVSRPPLPAKRAVSAQRRCYLMCRPTLGCARLIRKQARRKMSEIVRVGFRSSRALRPDAAPLLYRRVHPDRHRRPPGPAARRRC